MNETAKSRFLLDLDDLERQLRQPSQDERSFGPAPGSGAAPGFGSGQGSRVDDPLAELARIVGQEDPFRDLFNAPPRPAAPPRTEPAFDFGDVPLRGTQQDFSRPDGRAPDPFEAAFEKALLGDEPLPAAGDAARRSDDDFRPDDWDALAGRRAAEPELADDVEYPLAPVSAYDPRSFDLDQDYVDESRGDDEGVDEEVEPARRSRKGLIAVASVFAMAVAGVALALNYTGRDEAEGEPPLIKAAAEPVKVAPQNPGGVDIPNQNKQIYEGSNAARKPADANVVRQSEQPVDVNALLRANAARASQGQPNPDDVRLTLPEGLEPPSQTIPGLGEPRRVKTVAVRPDGSVIDAGQPAPAEAPAGAQQPAPQPEPATETAAAAATPSPPEPAPQMAAEPPRQPAQRSAPLSIVPQASQAQPRPAPAQPARVAAADPVVPAPDTRPAVGTAPRGGDFAVQLAARPTEASARESFAQLQRRYADLSAYQPIIRKAQVGERTVYRLRVGPMSREEATNLCSSLQAQGGDCFVARN